MRRRIRVLVPVAVAAALVTSACADPGSSAGGARPSGDRCAPVPGDELVVLADDQELQLADNVVPAVNGAAAAAHPELLPALDAVSAALTTQGLLELTAAVDLAGRDVAEVAAQWVTANVPGGLASGSGTVVVGAAAWSESRILAAIYARTLETAGFTTRVRTMGARERYLPALRSGAEIQVVPEYLATVTEQLNEEFNGPDAEPVATSSAVDTAGVLRSLADRAGLVFGQPAEAVDHNALAVTREFADTHGVDTLSELADACGDGSLVLGGPPECPTRPFCAPGLEEVYGLRFADVVPLESGDVIRTAIRAGEVSIGLVLSTDGAAAAD